MLKQVVAGQTLLISLRSWRYIAAVSFIAYSFTAILVFQTVSIFACVVSLSAGFITLFFCWRLWMDEQFFRLFYRSDSDRENFDLAIQTLWSKEMKPRSLEERWRGVARLIYRGWISVTVQWIGVLAALISALASKY